MEDIHSNSLYFYEDSPASLSTMMGSTDFFNQEETNEGITVEEEQIIAKIAKEETEDRKPKSKHDTKIFFNQKTYLVF